MRDLIFWWRLRNVIDLLNYEFEVIKKILFFVFLEREK